MKKEKNRKRKKGRKEKKREENYLIIVKVKYADKNIKTFII